MKTSNYVKCATFPCSDVKHNCYRIPDIEVEPAQITLMLISEAAPANREDDYYAGPRSQFAQTTILAFKDAGVAVESIPELVQMGVYLTTAVKCAKTGYGIQTATVLACAHILEQELALFPNVKAYLAMGDVAIKAINAIAKRTGEKRVIPAGSTYKIRNGQFFFRERRVLPSYLQAGPSFFIETSKRRMIAEDIARALQIVG